MKGWKIYSEGKLLSINSTRFGFESNFIALKEKGIDLEITYEEVTYEDINKLLEVQYERNSRKSDKRIKK